MKKLISFVLVSMLASLSITGCAVGAGGESEEDDEDIAEAEEALGCYVSGGIQFCLGEGDPYYPGGDGEPSCNECSYISAKHGYYYVCANGPGIGVTYHECEP